jgi:hypothetical protein
MQMGGAIMCLCIGQGQGMRKYEKKVGVRKASLSEELWT